MEPNDIIDPAAEPDEQVESAPIGEAEAAQNFVDDDAPEPLSQEEWDALPEGSLGISERHDDPDAQLKAILEAAVYITDEPLTAQQIAMAIGKPLDEVERLLAELVADYSQPHHGVTIREVAGGYKMTTKPEHHEAIRAFVKSLKPPLKLSLAALETLAVIAYKQPITAPEVMEIRGVQGAGVLKTLLDRKLITTAGRKNVVGKPILYKTTRDFLVQFGLNDLAELPTLKEFEELRKFALSDEEIESDAPEAAEAVPEVPAAVVETPPEAVVEAPEAVVETTETVVEVSEAVVEAPPEPAGEKPVEEIDG
jgi:segregation and condensation protein B